MNSKAVRNYIAEHEWVKVAGYMLACVAMLVIVHGIIVKPNIRRLDMLRDDLEQLKEKVRQYQGFADFQGRLNREEGAVSEVLSRFNTSLFTGAQTEKSFLDHVGDLCQQANIKMDHINPVNIDSGQAWNVSFTVPFPQMHSFLSLLEKSFRIEKLDIQRGSSFQSGHRVDMTIAPLTVSGGDGAVAGREGKTDIFALLNLTSDLAKKVQQKQAEMDANGQVSRDPFTGESLVKKPEAPKPRTEPVVEAPRVVIDGIFWDPQIPVVVIDGKALKEGETIKNKDAKIVKIKEDSVILQWHGRSFTLNVDKKGE